jgi:simple sugar transport system permease protein
MFMALLLSGAIAGLAGGIEVTGSVHKMVNGFSTGYGFTGIPVALMARNNPIAIVITGLFFGAMGSGSLLMQTSTGVSSDITSVIQSLVIIFLCAEYVLNYYIRKMRSGGRSNV